MSAVVLPLWVSNQPDDGTRRRVVETDAYVDTGASRTVVSPAVADTARLQYVGRDTTLRGVGPSHTAPLALAYVSAGECREQALLVAVDKLLDATPYHVILGQDFMEEGGMLVDMGETAASCDRPSVAADILRAVLEAEG
jgi:hypothetical protein